VKILQYIVIALFSLLSMNSALANDSAVSIGAGGLVLIREPRISMEKERLFISLKKITVDYDFVNETDADITTEVAFPLPSVDCVHAEYCPSNLLDDFKATTDGRPISLSTEIKAMVSGRDHAELLRSLHVDIAAFGHYEPTDDKQSNYDVEKLSKSKQQHLVELGVVSKEDNLAPLWTVVKTYYWSQKFPAGKIVHISHEYRPIAGYEGVPVEELDPAVTAERMRKHDASIPMLAPVQDSCFDARLRSSLKKDVDKEFARRQREPGYSKYVQMEWVNYILKTANSWKKPIKEFTLVLERPAVTDHERWYVSLCWDGKIERLDDLHLVAKAVDFVPERDLTVAFITAMPQP